MTYLMYVACCVSLTRVIALQWNVSRIGGSKGGARDERPSWGSKFFHFHAVFGKIIENNSPFGSWCPLLGKILDQPLFKPYESVCPFSKETRITPHNVMWEDEINQDSSEVNKFSNYIFIIEI